MNITKPNQNDGSSDDAQTLSLFSRSLTARESINRDIQEQDRDYGSREAPSAAVHTNGTNRQAASFGSSTFRRRSMSAIDQSPSLITPAPWPIMSLSRQEPNEVAVRDDTRRKTASLLTDDGGRESPSPHGSSTGTTLTYEDAEILSENHAEPVRVQDETSPLLSRKRDGNEDAVSKVDYTCNEAAAGGKAHSIWRTEAKALAHRSPPLILTAFLQSSLAMVGVLTVGHLGRVELGAISLGSMTASITGNAIYQGLVTSLDTLCAQAYGSGRKELVGLQMQRTVLFLWCVTVPIGVIWLNATTILEALVPESEKEVARLAGLYLKILFVGTPSLAAFEAGKRFMQAQGLFTANLYVLSVCAPLNALMNWLFVWQFQWGFVGAPIAIVVSDYLMLACLILYVRFIKGSECWGGFDKHALKNWSPMIWLAVPGLATVLAEYLAFEILTFAASWMSTSDLAAQAVLATIVPLMYQVPMQVSVAASTRIANLVGAAMPRPAKTAAKITLVVACVVGAINTTLLITLKNHLPGLFTQDKEVKILVSSVLPVCAAFQFYDALAASCNGILRGIGRQRFGGCVCLLAYYLVGIPISFGAGFGLNWHLSGLWVGPAVALFLVAVIEGIYIYHTNWARVVEEAAKRNTLSSRV